MEVTNDKVSANGSDNNSNFTNGKQKLEKSNGHVKQVKTTLPIKRHEVVKWDGWGYVDSLFEYKHKYDEADSYVFFKGDRYGLGQLPLPNLIPVAKRLVGLDVNHQIARPSPPDPVEPMINQEFIETVKEKNILISTNFMDRLMRSHGQSCTELWDIRHGTLERYVDAVVWPRNHQDVLSVISIATSCGVVIIPVGGATNVSGALKCPSNETRMVVALDTTQMCQLLWINEDNLTAHFQAGVVGQDLEKILEAKGYCCGHEPDSIEFSTLGGWVATRAAGIKRHLYGNIEDIVVHVKMASTIGTVERNCLAPRISSGPDLHHFILGSEGTLGVVTEVTIKIRPLPAMKLYGSYVFSCFEHGVHFLRDIAKQKLMLASVRFVDNLQLQLGKALKSEESFLNGILQKLKMSYLVNVKGFDLEKICLATLLFEGDKDSINYNYDKIHAIATKYGGIAAGEENGKIGYRLTYVIAYIRDLSTQFYILGDSFETAVPWDRVIPLCQNVKARICEEYAKRKLRHHFASCRITQAYDAGVCVYFYSGFCYHNSQLKNPAQDYEDVERIARQEVLDNGGSISHHHGVGKLQKTFLQKFISKPGMELLKAVKEKIDPQNIFANGNLMM
ncbi:hypothetical protein CHUAL_006803 [Chamberlinius hualienensis]